MASNEMVPMEECPLEPQQHWTWDAAANARGVQEMKERQPFEWKVVNPNRTPKQREDAAQEEMKRMWTLFMKYAQEKRLKEWNEQYVRSWIEQQVFNDAVQRGDFCPRCKKWSRGTVGCGTEGCKVGEFQMDYFCCNLPLCPHYLHVKQNTDADGKRRCFEHHLV